MQIDIGIPEQKRALVVEQLGKVLADHYTLYLMTHNFHWNVKGPMFTTLHTMFEAHYTELAVAVDDLAERIRALGAPAPATYKQFMDLTSIDEVEGVPAAHDMIRYLVKAHESLLKTVRDALPAAEDARDEGSVDMLVARLQLHEKTAWMLRAHLEG